MEQDRRAPLTRAFLRELGDEPAGVDLEATLAACVTRARTAWPTVTLAPEVFVAWLATRVAEGDRNLDDLARLHTDDLYLVCACLHRDVAALRALETSYFADVDVAVHRARLDSGGDDIKQRLRVKLLVGSETSVPKLGTYAGRAPLRSWLRMTITHAVLDEVDARRHRDVPAHEDEIDALSSTDPDPETHHFKAHYRAEFDRAFRAALEALSVEERALLHASLVRGEGIDEIAARTGVHRATAARRLHKARERLRAETRRHACALLRISDDEYDSIVRLVRSQFSPKLTE